VVGKMLTKQNKTIATAKATGGKIVINSQQLSVSLF
jgi:hypothetical protein